MNYRLLLCFSLFMILLSCKSHQKVEESTGSATDSCVTNQELRIQSLKNLEKNESITSNLIQDHMKFCEDIGEIQIHTNGEVTIKGLKSADITRHEICKKASTKKSISDSIIAGSHVKSLKTSDATSKSMTKNPTVSSLWANVVFFIVLIIIIIISMRYVFSYFSSMTTLKRKK